MYSALRERERGAMGGRPIALQWMSSIACVHLFNHSGNNRQTSARWSLLLDGKRVHGMPDAESSNTKLWGFGHQNI